MNIVNNRHLNKGFTLLVICSVLQIQSVSAAEWWKDFEAQSGFSGFAPPTSFSDHNHDKEKKEWRSGSSFNEQQKARYVPVSAAVRNPWKPVKSSHYKTTFSSQRPWGNVPERKPPKANNMKFHDQRFKQWSHKQDSSYLNNFRNSDSSRMYSGSSLPFMNNFGYPGSRYGNPLITPGINRGGFINPVAYGMNPYAFNPYSGLSNRPWNW